MGLPQLETCCFVFDLKTGNIILGGVNALGSFILTIIMIVMAVVVGQIEETGDIDIDAPVTGLYVMCILLTLMFLVRFLFDLYFIYGVIIERASIIKAYFIVWIVIFIMSSSIFFLNIESFNAGTICTELFYLGVNVYTILLSHSFYKQLNSREEV
ncbi:uncharacterized protein LOC106136312 isoform X2 [Amyelois transitella]|uniref:uncharacterized protein LOC106136312 isoform X2 n=1 Tax=Amyelois transitella TaxID=680683 RepID=UPI00067D0657|nr:uncharacterized protein LOC106136312 isoform X2 [Amyelois transitella]